MTQSTAQIIHRSFQKFCVWWQHHAVHHVAELKPRGACEATAAIAKVHYHCDISYNLAVGQARLQGSFLQTDMRNLIIFHVLLGKTALECYRSLKKGLGTHSPSHKTVG
jgi:hypothetical protein